MTTRITRFHGSTNLLSENADSTAAGVKRKTAALEGGGGGLAAPPQKRAALGEISNNAGKATLKKSMKKGLTNMVSKGKEGLKVQENKTSLLRQSLRKKKQGSAEKQQEDKSNKVEEKKENIVNEDDSSKSSTDDSSRDSSPSKTVIEAEDVKRDFTVVSPPISYTVPEGVIDFDVETKGDPAQHAEYARDTFQYYKLREAVFKIPNYMSAQKFISDGMRGILIDWLVEVQESFELNHETLYTAVKLTDLYLSKKQIRKEDLQLLGATACLIASKVDERLPPLVDDFLYVCDDAYTREKLLKMERKVLGVVGFDLGYPLSYRFLRRYGRVCKVTMPVLTLGRYILESSLLEYKFNVELSESLLAAATMALAFKVKGIEGWEKTLEYYSGLTLKEMEPVAHDLHAMLKRPVKENLKTVRSKYSHKVFHEVATIPVPETISF
eukprot:TRINITY_DN9357_c0_g1_i3.p1 TRINITY_DN9357_c0_g1~~TRINITY_DN9357_c0_g1_i3.p1  ORF type:complete len:440 (+),score=156.42 TRINITY_DN9357_c0_g1_i3:51-1370(+)